MVRSAACCLSITIAFGAICTPNAMWRIQAQDFLLLDQRDMKVDVYSSYFANPASYLLDGNKTTMWESDWSKELNVSLPVDAITLDLGAIQQDVSRFIYTPRQTDLNGKIKRYRIFAGTEKDDLTLVAEGTWDRSINDQTATFSSMDARYLTLQVIEVYSNRPGVEQTISGAEVNVAMCPNVVVNADALQKKIEEVKQRITTTENEVLKEIFTTELANVQAQMSEKLSQESYQMLIATLQKVLDSYSEDGFFTLPQAAMSVVYAPSTYAGNPLINMFDGNKETFWETNWGSTSKPFQSGDYILLDLGEHYDDVAQISYMPRQNSSNGRIKEYEIFVSNNDQLNGVDLKENGFVLAGKGTWEPDALLKTATFPSKTARYIAIKVNAVGGDGSTITCAELNVSLKKDVVVDVKPVITKIAEIKDIILRTDHAVIKEKLQTILSQVEEDVPYYTVEGVTALLRQLQEAIDTYATIGQVDTIRPGRTWVDEAGEPIQAHGGNIMYDEITKLYYWYGEHKGADNISTGAETGTPAIGISCYSSSDLYNWKNEGVALPVFNNPQIVDGTGNADTPLYISETSSEYQNSELPSFSGTALSGRYEKSPVNSLSNFNSDSYIAALNAQYEGTTLAEKQQMYKDFHWNRVVERPKVVYNSNTGKYVMWWHQDGPTVGQYSVASAGIAISDSPVGPFQYLETTRLPATGYHPSGNGEGMLRDMTLFHDDDGTGYVVYSSEENATTIIQKLNKAYTAPSGNVEGVDYKRIFAGQYREAPAMFKDNDTYYMVTSGQSGWNPNPCKFSYSTNGIFGDWTSPAYFCVDDIDLNDNPAESLADGTTFRSQSTNVLPYRDEQGNVVDGKFIYMGDRWKREDLKDSRYIWLPIDLNTNLHHMSMKWYDAWSLKEVFPTPESDYVNLKLHVNDPLGGRVGGEGRIKKGETTTISAIPNPGYKFLYWTDMEQNIITNESTFTFNIMEDSEYTAHFERIESEDVTLWKQILSGTIQKAMDLKSKGALVHVHEKVIQTFESSLQGALNSFADPNAQVNDLINAWETLASAMQLLDFTADKTALEQLLLECNALDLNLYKDDEYKTTFTTVLHEALLVFEDKNALDARIQFAYGRLLDAKSNLQIKNELDTTLLDYIIMKSNEALSNKDYYDTISSNWTIFELALEKATAVRFEMSSQHELDIVTRDLANAYENIRFIANEDTLSQLTSYMTYLSTLDLTDYDNKMVTTILVTKANIQQMIERAYFTSQALDSLISSIQKIQSYVVDDTIFTTNDTNNEDQTTMVIDSTNHVRKSTRVNAVKTGDHTSLFTLGGIMVVTGIMAALMYRKRRNKK